MTNKEYALDYLKLGYSVIPIGKNKKPLIEWKKYQSTKQKRSEIEAWWLKFPNANIGIVTGKISGLTIVDIDPRHGGSNEKFKDLQTPTVKTGGGGWHYYFAYEKELQNSSQLIKGIDIRSEGGYVIAPESVHESGNIYNWILNPHEASLLQLPQFIKDMVVNPINLNIKAKSWNTDILNGTNEGNRNKSSASIIGKLLKRFPRKEWETEAWVHIQNWNKQNNPPLNLQELRSTFNSIAKKETIKEELSGTEIPDSIKKQDLLSNEVTYQNVLGKFLNYLPNQESALKIILAVAASAYYENHVMLWLLIVGVPSSGKTDLVRLIKDSENVFYLDNLTLNAFISGERATKKQKVHDLLPLLDKKCLIIKDWTAIFSLDEKMTKKLLGELVGIYDKEFTKFSSRRGQVSYYSAFSQLGCVTPATLNKHTQYMNMVGARYLFYTMPPTTEDEKEQNYRKIFSGADRSKLEKEASLYTSSYLQQLTKKPFSIKPLAPDQEDYLRIAAELLMRCRGIVILQSRNFKNEDGYEITSYEVLDTQIEEPWRAIQQLILLTKYLTFVVGNNKVGIEELKIIKEIVISSMPADRSQALRMIKDQNGRITAKQLSDLSEKSSKTSRRLLDELSALNVLEKIKWTGTIANDYKISDVFIDFICLNTAEFLSNYSNNNTVSNDIKIEDIESNNVSSVEIENNHFIRNNAKENTINIFFGEEAIEKLVNLKVFKPGQKTCENKFKTTEENLWINDGNGTYHEVKAENVMCSQFLFWQIGNNLPQCSTCNPWYQKHDETEITSWYQTKQQNTDISQPNLLTYAENLAREYETINDNKEK